MKAHNRKRLFGLAILSAALWLQGCGSDNNGPTPTPTPVPPATANFEVTVSNLTNSQPLSPIAVIGHQDGYAVFSVGDAASASLEEMAEGGDNSMLLAEAGADALVTVTASGAAPIGPAGTETVTIEVLESDLATLSISIATMLVNTNDAFSALNAMSVQAMAVNDTLSVNAIAYDAGTEADTEAAGDIPGPAGGGEGFNVARSDDADRVSMHSGVISQDDGLSTSDLSEQHRFDNPVIRVQITRTL
jgi:hypothetical protein